MTTFQEDYERRLRALLKVPKDALDVFLDTSYEGGGPVGCDTCCDWADPSIALEARWRELSPAGKRVARFASRSFEELGELIRALDAVDDE
jgi:hypothetical protein